MSVDIKLTNWKVMLFFCPCFRKALRAAEMPQSSGILVSGGSRKWDPHPQVCLPSVLSSVSNSHYLLKPSVFTWRWYFHTYSCGIYKYGLKFTVTTPSYFIFVCGHWLVQSGRGHQCAVLWERPMRTSVCFIKMPAERDAAPDSLTQDRAWVNKYTRH